MTARARSTTLALLVLLLTAAPTTLTGCDRGVAVDAWAPVRQPLTQTLLLTGRLAPRRQLPLGAMVQGTVVEVLVEEGAQVEAGQALLRLADDEAQARLREAEARAREAEAQLSRSTGVGAQLADQRLQQARLEADEAQRAYDRAAVLHATGDLPDADFESARDRRDAAVSRRVSAQLEAAAQARGGADTRAAAARLAAAQANVEAARSALDRTTLRAPIDGTLLARDVEVGQVVRPGDALLSLGSDGPPEVVIQPDEIHLGALRAGQRALVLTEAFPDRPLGARVARVAPQVDRERGTVEVGLTLDDELGAIALLPQMSATVEIVLGERDDALTVPAHVVRGVDTSAPWVLVEVDGVATRRPVQLGLRGDEAIEIVDGLSADDRVLDGDGALAPDQRVRVRTTRQLEPPEAG